MSNNDEHLVFDINNQDSPTSDSSENSNDSDKDLKETVSTDSKSSKDMNDPFDTEDPTQAAADNQDTEDEPTDSSSKALNQGQAKTPKASKTVPPLPRRKPVGLVAAAAFLMGVISTAAFVLIWFNQQINNPAPQTTQQAIPTQAALPEVLPESSQSASTS